MIHELVVSVGKRMDVVEVAGVVRIALGVSVSVHSFHRDGHVASIRGSGAAMRRSSVHEAQSTHESNSSHNTRGDSRGRRGQSVRRKADGCRRGNRGRQNRAGNDDDDDGNGGWAYLRDEVYG